MRYVNFTGLVRTEQSTTLQSKHSELTLHFSIDIEPFSVFLKDQFLVRSFLALKWKVTRRTSAALSASEAVTVTISTTASHPKAAMPTNTRPSENESSDVPGSKSIRLHTLPLTDALQCHWQYKPPHAGVWQTCKSYTQLHYLTHALQFRRNSPVFWCFEIPRMT